MNTNDFIMGQLSEADYEDAGLDDFFSTGSSKTISEDPFYKKDLYILPQNRTPNKDDDFDISRILINNQKRYPEFSNYKFVAKLCASPKYLKIFYPYIIEHKQNLSDVILSSENFFSDLSDLNPKPFTSFSYSDQDFGIILKHIWANDGSQLYLFFNDIDKVRNTFFKKDIIKCAKGTYELKLAQSGYYLNKVDIQFNEKPILDESIDIKLTSDIDLFFRNQAFYNKNCIPYKRGILLTGAPGCGKTSIIKYFLNKYEDAYKLIVNCSSTFSGDLFEFIYQVFPIDGRKIIIFEDVDSINQEGYRSSQNRSEFLNFIDGIKSFENVVFLATTNYPDIVDPALIDRPSRFDRIYKIGYPEDASREKFLLKFFPELGNDATLLKECIKASKNFSGAYFKELFIMVNIQKTTIMEAILQLASQIKICRNKKFDDDSKTVMGLG